MAAWTLPAMIAEWCEILSSVLDRRSGKYFSRSFWECCWDVAAERCPAGSALPVSRMTGRITTTFCRHWAARQITSPNNCCMSLSGRFPSVMLVSSSSWLWMTRQRSGTGTKVQLAGMHHNPTPGPSGSEFLYGHVWVTISWLVKGPKWGCIGLPLLALMYVRQKDLQILERIGKAPWKFRTKL
ncbi:MAG: hypothetical protein RLZZ536_26, partial [Planctomycetota bacterium]